MKRTLQISGNSSYGGAGPLVLKWCEFLVGQGWQVDVLATDTFFVEQLKRIAGVKVIESIFIPRDIIPVRDVRAFAQLIRLLRRERYGVVHTYTATPGFLGRIAARLVGLPVILHHQAGWVVNEFSSPVQRIVFKPLEYLAVLASTKSICVSHSVAHQARQLHTAPQHKLAVVRNGIDSGPFIAATRNGSREAFRRKLGVPEDHLLIGNTSRLAPQKDNDTLIRAMLSIRSLLKDTPFTLLIAGDGPDRQKLESLVNLLGLTEHVRLLGFCRDIPAFLAAIDIFATPSLWEGLSISIMEAMAAAKPIVASGILPNVELIEHEVTGLVVPPRSPKRMAEAIIRFKRDAELAQRCVANARRRVLESFTIDRMLRETLDLYVSLMPKV